MAMENDPAVCASGLNSTQTDPHIVDRQAELVSLLSTTSMHICNIEPSNDADTISLKDSLKSTINDLLTEVVTGGVTIDKAGELQSPIRSVES